MPNPSDRPIVVSTKLTASEKRKLDAVATLRGVSAARVIRAAICAVTVDQLSRFAMGNGGATATADELAHE